MKNYLILLFFIPFIAYTSPRSNNYFKEKLIEVNPNWKDQNYSFDHIDIKNNLSEKELIQLHLSLVEKQLRESNCKSLTRKQNENRLHCLDILHSYWNNGLFPQNTYHSKRTPYFIDIYGTYCAVGYLIKETGFDAVAKKINKENNYGYLRDLAAQYEEIGYWAKEYGFELDELAWIQPMYIPPNCLPYNNFSNSYDTIIKKPCNSNGYIKVPNPSTWCATFPVSAEICSYENFFVQDSLPSGTYYIHVTDANNVVKTYVIDLKDSLKMVMHQQLQACTPNKLYSIHIDSVINGVSPFTYGVQDFFNNINFQPDSIIDSLEWWAFMNNNTPAMAIANDANGCFVREPYFPNPDFGFPIPFASLESVSCQNACSGSITIDSIWNAIGPVNIYKQINGNWVLHNSNVIDSLCVGIHHYKIQDSLGCWSYDQSANITMGSPANYFQLNITQQNVPLCYGQPVNLNVGINGGIPPYTQLIQNMGLSKMRVKVTDSLGCVLDTSVTIIEPAALKIEDSVVQTVCNLTPGIINIAAIGGTPPFTGVGNLILNSGLNNFFISDANGCMVNKYKNMPYYPVNISSSVVSPVNCIGDSGIVTISACGPAHPYTGVGAYVLPPGQNIITIQGSDGCTFYDTINISPINGINIGVNMLTPVSCNGDTAGIFVSATGGAAPYNGTGQFDLIAGSYTLTVSDNNGCVDDTVLNISQPAPVIISDSVLQLIHCFGDTAQILINATGGIAPYSGTGQFQFTAGTYTLSVADANNCAADTSITFTEPGPLYISDSIIQSIHCFGDTAIIEVNGIGGTPPYTGNGQFPFVAGTYTINITDANLCLHDTSITITQPSQLLIHDSLLQPILCHDDTVALVEISASGAIAPYLGTGQFNLSPGVHIFTVTDANNCNADISVTITAPAMITQNMLAWPDNGTGNGSAQCNVAGGTLPYTYLWSNAAASDSISSLVTGWYTVIITDANACTSTDSVFVAIKYPEGLTEIVEHPLYIYPNPTTDKLHIQFDAHNANDCTITLTSKLGQTVRIYQVRTVEGQNNIELSLKDIAKGMYLLTVNDGKYALRQKVVVE